MIPYLERHNDEKNMHRYYCLAICPTLFSEYTLVRERGRCPKRSSYVKIGRRKEVWFGQETEAQAAAEKLKDKKCRKRYQLKAGYIAVADAGGFFLPKVPPFYFFNILSDLFMRSCRSFSSIMLSFPWRYTISACLMTTRL